MKKTFTPPTLTAEADFGALTQGLPISGSDPIESDRNVKMNFRALDGEQVLGALRALPVTEWSYISKGPGVRHVGPMAQDFHAAFGLGVSDLTITTSDMSGVTMRAVQALVERTDRLGADVAALRQENTTLRTELERLMAAADRPDGL